MISNILAALFQICITALIIKIYHDSVVKKYLVNKGNTQTNWNEASLALEKLEARNVKLQTRETASQERVWHLEDENRILKSYVQQMKRRAGDTSAIPGISTQIVPPQIASNVIDADEQDEDRSL